MVENNLMKLPWMNSKLAKYFLGIKFEKLLLFKGQKKKKFTTTKLIKTTFHRNKNEYFLKILSYF